MPTRPPAILCIGKNYADHAAEMGGAAPERLVLFMKNPASACGDGDAIVIPAICDENGPQVDYEGELAVIVGRDCRDVPEDRALSFVGGYAAANDVSARWWQREGGGGQFCVKQQIAKLEVGGFIRQLFDRIATVQQFALVAIDIGDRTFASCS